tara:strand:+ start:349 stop:615 length:267 start_codon:yes stop_codon:yes gene_type:complete
LKNNKKYVTVDKKSGLGLHAIAKVMTEDGDKMNHSTVRNILNRSFSKVVKNISNSYGLKYNEDEIKAIAKSPQFQESLIEVLRGKNND